MPACQLLWFAARCSSLKVNGCWCKLQCQSMDWAGWGKWTWYLWCCASCGCSSFLWRGGEGVWTWLCARLVHLCLLWVRAQSYSFQPGQTRRSWLAHEIVVPASSHPCLGFNRHLVQKRLGCTHLPANLISFDCAVKRVCSAYHICSLVIVSGLGQLIGCSFSRAVRAFNPLEKNYLSWW